MRNAAAIETLVRQESISFVASINGILGNRRERGFNESRTSGNPVE